MRSTDKVWVMAVAAALVLALVLDCPAQGLGRRYSMDEMRQMVTDSELIVRARAAEEPVTVPGETSGLVWRVPFEVIQVEKGQLAEKTLELRLKSVINDLNCSRKALVGKQFVLPLKAFAEGGAGQFRLTADAGFESGSAEADTVVQIAGGRADLLAATTGIRLRLESSQAAYEAGTAIVVKVALENEGSDAATYGQAPFEVRDAALHIYGAGGLVVMNDEGGNAPSLGGLHVGGKPGATTLPVILMAGEAYRSEFDLARCVDLAQAGSYTVFMAVETPDRQQTVKSNFLTIQVIDPLATPVPPPIARPPAADEIRIPSPDAYQPGEAVNGLVGLLKPRTGEYQVGRQILMELRLINTSEMAINVETRLERTILVTVQEQGASPAVRPVLQRIEWPEDPQELITYPYAHLQPRAFWGKLLDVNSFYGRDALSLMEGGSAPPAPGSRVSYETHGMTLFSFDSPGVYKVQLMYQVKPRAAKGPRVWTGKLLTNPVFIRVVPEKGAEPAAPLR